MGVLEQAHNRSHKIGYNNRHDRFDADNAHGARRGGYGPRRRRLRRDSPRAGGVLRRSAHRAGRSHRHRGERRGGAAAHRAVRRPVQNGGGRAGPRYRLGAPFRRAAPPGGVRPRHPARRCAAHLPGPGHPSEDRRPEVLCRRHPRQHGHLRHRAGWHGEDLPGHGHGGGGIKAQGGRPHRAVAPHRGGRREPRLSAGHPLREGGSLYPAALRCAVLHVRSGAGECPHRERHHRDRSSRLHARAHVK